MRLGLRTNGTRTNYPAEDPAPPAQTRHLRPLSGSAGRLRNGDFGEGFRMPASTGRASGLGGWGAGVGKPPKDERAGDRPALWRFGAGGGWARARRRARPTGLAMWRASQKLGGGPDHDGSLLRAGRRHERVTAPLRETISAFSVLLKAARKARQETLLPRRSAKGRRHRRSATAFFLQARRGSCPRASRCHVS